MADNPLLAAFMAPSADSQRRQMAAQMLANIGNQPAPKTWMEGLTRGLGSLGSAYFAGQGIDKDEADRNEVTQMLSANAGAPRDQLIKVLSSSPNSMAQRLGQTLQMGPLLANPSDENFKLETVAGPDGKPMLVQSGSHGTIRDVSGYGPKPDKDSAAGWKEIEPGHWKNLLTGQEDITPGAFDRSLMKAKAGATNVNTQVSPTAIYSHEEGAAMKPLYEGIAKNLDQFNSDAIEAQRGAQAMRNINRELEGVETGMGSEWKTSALKALRATGLSNEAADRELAKRENAIKMKGERVMERLNAMKGPATEKEYERLTPLEAGQDISPAGRAEMQRISEHQAARLEERAARAAEISNMLQQRGTPVGDIQNEVRKVQKQVDAKYDSMLSQQPVAAAKKPAKIKIDAQGNIIP